jgi:hypothetical protein
VGKGAESARPQWKDQLKPRFLSREDIAESAWQMLQEWSYQRQEQLTVPIDIDRFINEHLNIPVLYGELETLGEGVPLAKATDPSIQEPCRITVNEDLVDTVFAEYPGLERTTLAHEAGHCVFHVNHSRAAQLEMPFGESEPPPVHYAVQELIDPESMAKLHALIPDKDHWWREWQAHTFMRYILMPKALILEEVALAATLDWPTLYRLRSYFDVTISALAVHLQELRCISIDNKRVIDRRGESPRLPLFS